RAQDVAPAHRTPDHRRARLASPIVELYPAVDVQGGRVARSASPDPLAVARQFARDGARWVHFVDLDRALGTGDNRELARRFLAGAAGAARLFVQVGGALGTEAVIDEMLGWGAGRVVIGTAAAVDATLLARLLARHGADRLAVGIDARDGRLAARAGLAGAIVGRALHERWFTLAEALACVAG